MSNTTTVSKVEQIKAIRIDVDRLINTAKLLKSSREVSLCHTNLQRCKHWLGKLLGAIDSQNPYPHSSDAASPVIEKQAEHTDNVYVFSAAGSDENATHVSNVKEMRSYIDAATWRCDEFSHHVFGMQAYLAAEEAKMWLGWELDRIRIATEAK